MNELVPSGFDLARWLDIVAPGQGGLIVMWEAYFDESDTDDADGLMTIAGYVFDKEQCIDLDHKWNDLLLKYGLPFFRMSACAHGRAPFDHLGPDDRDCAAREAIRLIRDNMKFGVSVSIGQHEYEAWMPIKCDPSEAYVWCAYNAMMAVRAMADEANFSGQVAYVFEAGHQHQTKANRFMQGLVTDDNLRVAYRYASHSFVDKRYNRPVQTPDLLAWHSTQLYRKSVVGKPMRKDYAELIRGQEDKYVSLRGNEKMFNGVSIEGWKWFLSGYRGTGS